MRPFALLLPALLLAACDGGSDAPQGTAAPGGVGEARTGAQGEVAGILDRSLAGTPAPGAGFRDPRGKAVSLASFRGRPLLVNLWATWCAPCIAEMPTLDALAAREKGLQVLAVSQDIGGREKVDAFFAERGFRMLQPFVDPELSLMSELKVTTLPTTILYDAQGREVWRMTGMEDWQGSRAAGLLREGLQRMGKNLLRGSSWPPATCFADRRGLRPSATGSFRG